ncbi:MAG: hypothetical protein JWO03_3381 [Bacteroidetes bacterium]|nr:hypothetical protein [Bacteroidota bacterium]
MKTHLFLLGLCACIATSSCNLIQQKVVQGFDKMNEQESKVADSLRAVLISQRQNYAKDTAFAASMDTLYEHGFRLAALCDSIRTEAGGDGYLEQYGTELYFFHNFVNHHFEYDEHINSLQMVIGMGGAARIKGKKTERQTFVHPMLTVMVKPAIMRIIFACRSQYAYADSSEAAD